MLNVNAGSVLAAYLHHKMGVDNEFKISAFMGIDNPYSIFWTLMTTRMFSRVDGSTSLIGFNLPNSDNNKTIREALKIRKDLGLEKVVRFEHHITETYKSFVREPYNGRRTHPGGYRGHLCSQLESIEIVRLAISSNPTELNAG